MHEGNFTKQIVDSILNEIHQYPSGIPRSIKVKVGETYHLESESVQMHFKTMIQGTRLENSELILHEAPFFIRCGNCRWEGHPEDHHYPICGSCSSTKIEVLDGNEVIIEEIELDDD